MARYYFHIRGGERDTIDEEGAELPDDIAARATALRSARGLIAADVLTGQIPTVERIDVEVQGRGRIFSISFKEAVGLG